MPRSLLLAGLHLGTIPASSDACANLPYEWYVLPRTCRTRTVSPLRFHLPVSRLPEWR